MEHLAERVRVAEECLGEVNADEARMVRRSRIPKHHVTAEDNRHVEHIEPPRCDSREMRFNCRANAVPRSGSLFEARYLDSTDGKLLRGRHDRADLWPRGDARDEP